MASNVTPPPLADPPIASILLLPPEILFFHIIPSLSRKSLSRLASCCHHFTTLLQPLLFRNIEYTPFTQYDPHFRRIMRIELAKLQWLGKSKRKVISMIRTIRFSEPPLYFPDWYLLEKEHKRWIGDGNADELDELEKQLYERFPIGLHPPNRAGYWIFATFFSEARTIILPERTLTTLSKLCAQTDRQIYGQSWEDPCDPDVDSYGTLHWQEDWKHILWGNGWDPSDPKVGSLAIFEYLFKGIFASCTSLRRIFLTIRRTPEDYPTFEEQCFKVAAFVYHCLAKDEVQRKRLFPLKAIDFRIHCYHYPGAEDCDCGRSRGWPFFRYFTVLLKEDTWKAIEDPQTRKQVLRTWDLPYYDLNLKLHVENDAALIEQLSPTKEDEMEMRDPYRKYWNARASRDNVLIPKWDSSLVPVHLRS